MTREEAKQIISDIDYAWRNFSRKEYVALEMAIKALEQESCEDAISRQAAIDAIYACYIGGKEAVDKAPASDHYAEGIDEAVCAVENLPPVTPKQKTGRWILTDDDFVYCSECEDSYYPRPIDASWYYCPHCGAKMESEDEEI